METDNQIFNVFEQVKPVNHNINLIITPDLETTSYTYTIYKNGNIFLEKTIENNEFSVVNLNETGKFEVIVIEAINEEKKEIKSGIYNIDKEAPIIEIDKPVVTIKLGEKLDLSGLIHAYDNQDGDLFNKVSSNINEIDLNTLGIKRIIYTVSDEAGNTSAKALNLNIIENKTTNVLLIQGIIIFLILISFVFICFYRKSLKREKRIAKFAIEPINDKTITLFDKFLNVYYKILTHLKKTLKNFRTIKKYSKKYEKYVYVVNNRYKDGIDFVASKIVISLLFLLLAIFSKAIKNDVLKFYEISIPLLAGFYIPDIVYYLNFRKYKSSIENDLLQAVMIMNNAFKSGRSITQAIDLVVSELDGPVKEQFKKLSIEIGLGLSVEDAFKRLEERLPLEEVNYLTASITILNKTGGNIVKVFTSIEKNLFNKKRLKLELKSLTGSSRIISYVLFAVPLLFVVFISVLDSTYFVPFFTTTIGLILMVIMIIIYVIYIFFVTKIMKVKL